MGIDAGRASKQSFWRGDSLSFPIDQLVQLPSGVRASLRTSLDIARYRFDGQYRHSARRQRRQQLTRSSAPAGERGFLFWQGLRLAPALREEDRPLQTRLFCASIVPELIRLTPGPSGLVGLNWQPTAVADYNRFEHSDRRANDQ
jgi:hypothetical protein